MRRLLINTTVFAIILNLMFIPAQNVSYAVNEQQSYDKAVGALLSFDILLGEFEDISQDELLTREQVAMWLYRLTEQNVEYEVSTFSDVPVGSQYANAILSLSEKGIISGYPDGKFRPLEPIQYAQFAKILVDLLGYGKTASIYGGYPLGYLRVASSLKIEAPVYPRQNQQLTVGQGAQILYNALQVDVQGIVIEQNRKSQVHQEIGKTLLVLYKDIYKVKGRVTKNAFTGLTQPNGAGEGKAEIGGAVYRAGKIDVTPYLGQEVTLFYREYQDGNEIVHLEPKKDTDEIVIDSEDILYESSTRTKLAYENESGRQVTVDISPVADIIYNGKASADLEVERLYPRRGEIKLLDSDFDGVYDVVFVMDYDVFFVSNVSAYNRTIYNRFKGVGFTPSIQLPQEGIIEIFDEFGDELEFSDIATNDIVFIAGSEAGRIPYYRILVSKKAVFGAPSSIRDDAVEVDGVDYEISKELKEAIDGKLLMPIDMSGEYEFYLNVKGQITGYVRKYFGNQYGYLRKVYYNQFENTAYLKIFCRDGTWQQFQVEKTVTFNGNDMPPSMFAKVVGVNEFVRYVSNKDNRIIRIDTALQISDQDQNMSEYVEKDVFRKAEINNTLNNNKFYINNKSFSNTYFFGSSPTVFLIPMAQNAEDDEFACTDTSYFISENRYTLTVYDMDEYMFSNIFVVSYDSTSSSYLETSINHDDYCLMVEKVSSAFVDGMEVSVVSGVTKGQKWSYTSSEANTFKGLRRGDIIRTKYDDSGKLSKYIMVHRLGTEDLVSNVPDVNNAVYIFGNVLNVDYAGRRMRINEGLNRTIIIPESIYITIYDKQEDEIRVGGLQDIAAGDYIVFRMRSSVPYEIFIIR